MAFVLTVERRTGSDKLQQWKRQQRTMPNLPIVRCIFQMEHFRFPFSAGAHKSLFQISFFTPMAMAKKGRVCHISGQSQGSDHEQHLLFIFFVLLLIFSYQKHCKRAQWHDFLIFSFSHSLVFWQSNPNKRKSGRAKSFVMFCAFPLEADETTESGKIIRCLYKSGWRMWRRL